MTKRKPTRIITQTRTSSRNGKKKLFDSSRTVCPIKSKFNLLDLPQEMIEKIIDNIRISERHHIRESCYHLKNVVDSLVISNIRKIVNGSKFLTSNYETILVQLIYQNARVFIDAGLKSIVTGAILSIYRTKAIYFFSPCLSLVETFITKLHSLVERAVSGSQRSIFKVLYLKTMLGLLHLVSYH